MFKIDCEKDQITEPLNTGVTSPPMNLVVPVFRFTPDCYAKIADVERWRDLTGFNINDQTGHQYIKIMNRPTYLEFDNDYEMTLFKLYFKVPLDL
jgi:hypothetical protein